MVTFIHFLLHVSAVLFALLYLFGSFIGFFWFETNKTTVALFLISILSVMSIFWAYAISIKLIPKRTSFICIGMLIIALLINIFLAFSTSQNIFYILLVFFSIYFIYILKQK